MHQTQLDRWCPPRDFYSIDHLVPQDNSESMGKVGFVSIKGPEKALLRQISDFVTKLHVFTLLQKTPHCAPCEPPDPVFWLEILQYIDQGPFLDQTEIWV